ncbi:MAG: guanylate kinase [Pseudonocardiaceae bacterium]|nr:guanylate kinase [Pseudonocardiaceae bacterium]
MTSVGTAEEPGRAAIGRSRLTVVSGPSGVGKSSVVAEARRRRPAIFASVSVTTRPPRAGERDGEHYHFVDRETFAEMVSSGQLLEHAEYAGNGYGTPEAPVRRALEAGRPALLEIELQGARQIRAAMPDSLLVLLAPPSWEALVDRLSGRGTEDPAVLARRLRTARTELEAAAEFDATVVNDDVQRAAGDLLALMVGDRPNAAGRPPAERDQAVLFNASTVLTLAIGVGFMYVGLLVVNFLVCNLIIAGTVLGQYVGGAPGLFHYANIAWLVTSAATIAGAVGSGFETEESVRQAAYSYHEQERRSALSESEPDPEDSETGNGETSNPARDQQCEQ